MVAYEYNQMYVSFLPDADGTNHISKLNEFGKNGWELITAIKVDQHNVCYIFKRPLSQYLSDNAKSLLMENN